MWGAIAQGVLSLGGSFLRGKQASKKQVEGNVHVEHMAPQQAYLAEWKPQTNRTWFDSLVEGLNRLVRPTCTFGVIYLFVYCVQDPYGFQASMQALALMPDYGWILLSTIIAFWFGGRFVHDLAKRPRMPKVDLPPPPPKKEEIIWETPRVEPDMNKAQPVNIPDSPWKEK